MKKEFVNLVKQLNENRQNLSESINDEDVVTFWKSDSGKIITLKPYDFHSEPSTEDGDDVTYLGTKIKGKKVKEIFMTFVNDKGEEEYASPYQIQQNGIPHDEDGEQMEYKENSVEIVQ
jgi:hypothetical protein